RPSDGRSDLAASRAAKAREPILVPDDARDDEVHAAAGVGHPLDHVHVEDLVLCLRQQDVDDLGLPDGPAGLDRVPATRNLPADVEDRFLQALRGSPAAREIAGQIGRGQIPGPRGPTMLLELERLGGREHTVSGRLRDDQLHDCLPQRLSDHRPRLPAPEELRSYAVIGPALPPTTEGYPVVRTLCHLATPSRRTPAARNCWSRWAFD